jgi:hypothetical protein
MNSFLNEQKQLMSAAVAKLTEIETAEVVINEAKKLDISQGDKLEIYRKAKLAGLHLQYGDLVTELMKNFCDEMGLEIIEKEQSDNIVQMVSR